MPKDSTEQPTAVAREAAAISQLCEGIEVLVAALESEPAGRLEWLLSIRDRLAVIQNDLSFARFGLTPGDSR